MTSAAAPNAASRRSTDSVGGSIAMRPAANSRSASAGAIQAASSASVVVSRACPSSTTTAKKRTS